MAGYHSHSSPSLYGSNYQTSISDPIQLSKGERYPLQWTYAEGNGHDYMRVSVGYHGKDLEAGTRIDKIKKSAMKQDSYVYDHQKIELLQKAEQDYIYLVFPENKGIGFLTNSHAVVMHSSVPFRSIYFPENNPKV